MQAQTKRILKQLLPLSIQAVVGMAVLSIIWLVVLNLPMLREIHLPLQFNLAELFSAIALMMIVTLLLNFSVRVKKRLSRQSPIYFQSGALIQQLVFPIAVLLTYIALTPLVVPYLSDLAWIYHLLFLIAFLLLSAVPGYAIYRLVCRFTVSFPAAAANEAPADDEAVCKICGGKYILGTCFCSSCDEKPPQPLQCNSCGQALDHNSRYCSNCGAAAGASLPPKADRPETPACVSCGITLKPGGRFCPSCGAAAC